MSEKVNEVKVEEAELRFANLNNSAETLVYFQALSAEKLLDQIKQIRQPLEIVSIYASGAIHFAWVRTHGKIKKISKRKEP